MAAFRNNQKHKEMVYRRKSAAAIKNLYLSKNLTFILVHLLNYLFIFHFLSPKKCSLKIVAPRFKNLTKKIYRFSRTPEKYLSGSFF